MLEMASRVLPWEYPGSPCESIRATSARSDPNGLAEGGLASTGHRQPPLLDHEFHSPVTRSFINPAMDGAPPAPACRCFSLQEGGTSMNVAAIETVT